MPWDATRLYVADLADQGLGESRQVAGGAEISVIEPQWGADGDADLALRRERLVEPLRRPRRRAPPDPAAPGRVRRPALDARPGQLCADGRRPHRGGGARSRRRDACWLIDRSPAAGQARSPCRSWPSARSSSWTRRHVAMLAGSASESAALVVVDIATGGFELVRRPSPSTLAAALRLPRRADQLPERERAHRPRALLSADQRRLRRAGGREAATDRPGARRPDRRRRRASFSLGIQYWTTPRLRAGRRRLRRLVRLRPRLPPAARRRSGASSTSRT